MDSIFIVTLTEDYQLVNQFAYHSREEAITKRDNLEIDYFEDSVSTVNKDDYDEVITTSNYEGSEAWWDNDERISIHFEEITVE